MKLLLAIMSCQAHRYTHQACRDTWLRRATGVDRVFFLGGEAQAPDELGLPVQDDYEHVTEKSLALFEWALDRGYSHVLHCGRDTYVHVPRLLRAGHDERNYVGASIGGRDRSGTVPLIPDGKGRFAYASGGGGSFLSAKAMRIILDSPIRHVADDLMYGWILGFAGIPLYHDTRFMKSGSKLYTKDQITVHLSRSTGNYEVEWMYQCHDSARWR